LLLNKYKKWSVVDLTKLEIALALREFFFLFLFFFFVFIVTLSKLFVTLKS
jgi:hypothetical protein